MFCCYHFFRQRKLLSRNLKKLKHWLCSWKRLEEKLSRIKNFQK